MKSFMPVILRIFYNLRTFFSLLLMIVPQTRLARKKKYQVTQFNNLKKNFTLFYNNLGQKGIDDFVTPFYRTYNSRMEKILLPFPPFSFLRTPEIMRVMFASFGGRALKEELSFLESKLSQDRLKFLLEEEYIGAPVLLNSTYLTSHNSIHHLYHLVKFMEKTQCSLSGIKTIVEWGGGYWNIARIIKRFKGDEPTTIIIIDTPLFSCLQWLYLATVLGEEQVNLLKKTGEKICEGKINLLPLSLLRGQNISADLFLSTWALDESSRYSLDFVVEHDWFGAKHLLLAYLDSSCVSTIALQLSQAAMAKGAVIEDIKFLPDNCYAFV